MTFDERKKEIHAFYEKVLPTAKSQAAAGTLSPIVFGLSPTEQILIPLNFDSYEEKRAKYAMIGKALRSKGCYGAVLVNESWWLNARHPAMSKADRERILAGKVMPSEHHLRQEAVSVLLTTFGYSRVYVHPFHRKNNRIVWEPELPLEEEGHLENFLFPAFEEDVH